MTELPGAARTEVPLSGGNTSAVVRVGETVRRSTSHWTSAVHGVLRHLEHAGFEGSPRVLGRDDRGRGLLTYLPGKSPYGSPWPSRFWSDSTLVQVGQLLRRYHEAVRDYRPSPDSRWAWSWVPLHHPALTRQLGGPGARSQARRLALLCSAYGDAEEPESLSLIHKRVAASRDGIRAGVEGDPINDQAS